MLVQQRPPGKPMAGLWEFPGGKVEPGEAPQAALVRELVEELGVTVAHDALAPATFASEPLGAQQLVLLLFATRAWSGEPEPRHASALRWVTPAELRDLSMPPADLPMIDVLERMLRDSQ
jgi:8-oxo-dGTP diphosphatase